MSRTEKGQSTIEFLATFSMMITLSFFFYKIAVNFTNGYLIHYATFMASRGYLVYEKDEGVGVRAGSFTHAKNIFKVYPTSNFNSSATSSNLFHNSGAGTHPIFNGVYLRYKESFSLSRLTGGTDKMDLVSESFLGKEPMRRECIKQVCDAISIAVPALGSCGHNITIFDNGC